MSNCLGPLADTWKDTRVSMLNGVSLHHPEVQTMPLTRTSWWCIILNRDSGLDSEHWTLGEVEMVRSDLLSLFIVGVLFCLSCGCVSGAVNLDNIVGLWLFDGDDPDEAMDSSGGEHNGQIKGAQLVDGKYKGALQFDGVDDVVVIPDAEDLTLSTFTLAAWFNSVGPNDAWQGIVAKDSWPVRNYSLYIHRDTRTVGSNFVHDADPNAHKEAVGVKKVMDEQWHHGAVTYDRANLRIYTDGVMETQRAVTDTPDENNLPVRIGMEGAFNGMIDEVIILNVALEADDIGKIMEGISEILSPVEPEARLAILWGDLKDYE